MLIPSLTATIGSGSSTANLSLTNAETIANTLTSAVQGTSSSSASTASQVANEAVTGLLSAVGSLSSALGRKLLMAESDLGGGAVRKLLQSNSTAVSLMNQPIPPDADPIGTLVMLLYRMLC